MHHFQMLEVDPQRIKFNPKNPRRHRGTEFLRLKASLEEVGVVQVPTVRVLSGGFYECIDGEGRVQAAKEAQLKAMPVASVGPISDQEALVMLQSANAVRSFHFLMECRGLANLYRQGISSAELAEKFGTSRPQMLSMIGVGDFPEKIQSLILDDIAQSEDEAHRWTPKLLTEILPLRQELTEQQGYTYEEVELAVQKVLEGKIHTISDMKGYVGERRSALFRQYFDQALEQKLEQEIEQTKHTLEEEYKEELKIVEEQTASQYRLQVEALQEKFNDLKKKHDALVKDVAKRPEMVEQYEAELRQKMEATEKERLQLQKAQQEVLCQLEKKMKEQLEVELQKQRDALSEEYAQREIDLQALYARKDRDLTIKAQVTMQQILAQGLKTLVEAQQWTIHLMTPDVLKGLIWISDAEMKALCAEIQAVRETLEKAEDKLTHSDFVLERNFPNGFSSYH